MERADDAHLAGETYSNTAILWHNGDSGSRAHRAKPESSITIYVVTCELACFVNLCQHPLHWLRLVTQAFFIGTFHCFIFVPYLAFRVHVTGDLNQKLSFVVGVVSTSIARPLGAIVTPKTYVRALASCLVGRCSCGSNLGRVVPRP